MSLQTTKELEIAAERTVNFDPIVKMLEGDLNAVANFNEVGGLKGMIMLVARQYAIGQLERLNTSPYKAGGFMRRTMVDVNEQRKALIKELSEVRT